MLCLQLTQAAGKFLFPIECCDSRLEGQIILLLTLALHSFRFTCMSSFVLIQTDLFLVALNVVGIS